MSDEDREYFEATQLCREPPKCPTCDKPYRETHEGPGDCDDCFDRSLRQWQEQNGKWQIEEKEKEVEAAKVSSAGRRVR